MIAVGVLVLAVLLPWSADAGQREVCIPEDEMVRALAEMDKQQYAAKLDQDELALRRALDKDQKALIAAQSAHVTDLEARLDLAKREGVNCVELTEALKAENTALRESIWWSEAKHWAGHAALFTVVVLLAIFK